MPASERIWVGWLMVTVTVTCSPLTVTVPVCPDVGEVVLGVLGGLGGVEGDLAGRAVEGDVDGLCPGAGGGLGVVDGLHLGRQGEPAVEDEAGHDDEGQGEDDDEGGDHAGLGLAEAVAQTGKSGVHVRRLR